MPKANLRGQQQGFKKREPMTHADKLYNERHQPGVHQGWVDHITDSGVELSEREQSFVDSCERRLRSRIDLTEAMIDWLESIYNKVD